MKMYPKKRVKIAIIMLVSSFYAHGASIIIPENFQANFTEKITNTKNKTINYKGKVRFSDKTKMKWSFLAPTKKETCVNDKALMVVDHDLEQVSHYIITKKFNLIETLKKAKLYKKNIYLAHMNGKSVTIQVDNQGKIHSIARFDDLDNKVQIIFKNVKYGKGSLSQKSMTCKVPKAYDVIDG